MEFQELHNVAHEAGKLAAKLCVPDQFQWSAEGSNATETHPECGCAWVCFAGNTAWGRWAKAQGIASRGVYKGLEMSDGIDWDDQSMQVREKYCLAYQDILTAVGISSYVRTYLT